MVQKLRIAKGSRVLDLCCEIGRLSIELAKRDVAVVGIQFNADYLARATIKAQEAGVSPQFVCGDVRYVDFASGFDAAIIMYHSFGYFSDSDDRAILRKVYETLKPGGRFLIEILSRDFLVRDFTATDERTVEGITIRGEGEFDLLSSRSNSVLTRFEPSGPVVKRIS